VAQAWPCQADEEEKKLGGKKVDGFKNECRRGGTRTNRAPGEKRIKKERGL
jgi:hypothetical protein